MRVDEARVNDRAARIEALRRIEALSKPCACANVDNACPNDGDGAIRHDVVLHIDGQNGRIVDQKVAAFWCQLAIHVFQRVSRRS